MEQQQETDDSTNTVEDATLPTEEGSPIQQAGFSTALDQRDNCSRYRSDGSCFMLAFVLILAFVVTLYFFVPWVPVVEDVLDWVDGRGTSGILLLVLLHQISLYAIVGPVSLLEYCWVFLRGWYAAPSIIMSYIVGITVMLYIGNTVLRPWILRRVRDNAVMQATQRVLDKHPYMWYIAFQFWSLVPWRAGVYCAHVLAPHAFLPGIGVAVLIGQLPGMLYGIFLATRITDLDSLVTGRLDTPRDTAIFWGSVGLNVLISLILYIKIRSAFHDAARLETRIPEQEATDMALTHSNQARIDP
jgi:uncharacterized membrane protein YdjX (TVP38/TMEM64 family)